MIIFTTIEHLNGRGVPASLTRRFGKDYQVVLIDPHTVKEMRKQARRSTKKRIRDTIPSRDDIVVWLRKNDTSGIPWPKYTVEGL